jgi:branched-chain amino acid transport system permease protein
MNGELLLQSAVLGLLTGGVYALTASGLTLIFGIMRVVNVAHAAMILMSAYLSWWLYKTLGLDPLVSILVVMPVFFLLGALVQWTILRRLAGRDLTLTVLVTFGFAIILEGTQGALFSSSFQAIKTSYSLNSFEIFGIYVPLVRLLSGFVALVLLGGLYVILGRTNLGRAIRATTQDPRSAALIGVNVEFVTMLAFALGVSMAAAGGPLLGMIFAFYPSTHWLWIGKLLAIVVLGGLGSLEGTVVAAMILGMAEQVMTVTVSLDWAPLVFYFFLFGVLIVRPRGLFGTVARESL